MAEGVTQPSAEEQGVTITEFLNEMCAQYMVMGMTYDEFWNSSIERWKVYDRYYMLQTEKENQDSWWLGAYIYEGFSTVMANAFGKGSKVKYPEKPHRITPLTEDEKAIEEAKNKAQLKAYFESLAATINKKGKRKQEQLKADELNAN